ncbi:MAG: sigma-70 family RNA polymerase sigma factor [Phycisphaerae bacterium]|nr:sigma-70 family RNA polymerase sigma factor [Phycisphaerae bacterium]
MADNESNQEFPVTSWMLVRSAAEDPAARAELCARYFRPTYAFLRQLGCDRLDAEDLAQEFFARHVLDGRFLTSAREERGSFRSFLRTSLAHFRVDAIRKERGRSGDRPRSLSFGDPAALDAIDLVVQDHGPDEAFDRAWAHALLEDALRDAEAECRRKGQELHWEAFERHRILPVRSGGPVPSLTEIGQAIGLDPRTAADRIETVHRRVVRHVERRAGFGCSDQADREAECRYVKALLIGK